MGIDVQNQKYCQAQWLVSVWSGVFLGQIETPSRNAARGFRKAPNHLLAFDLPYSLSVCVCVILLPIAAIHLPLLPSD
jgi:hypothetical protein